MLPDLTRIARPLDGVALDRLADGLAQARVVGVGPTTREGEQTSRLQHDLLVRLVERGFRLLVIADSTAAGRRLDAWVGGGEGTVAEALRIAWGPWRTPATATALTWLRRHNREHPDDPVHVAGLTEPAATNADVDAVLALVGDDVSPSVREALATIRTAHDSGEHALRAQGLYEGPAFDVLARRARSEIAGSDLPGQERALVHLDRLVTFHATSMSQGGDPFAGIGRAALGLLEMIERSGQRAVLWDGEGGVDADGPGAGRHLREALGQDYRSVLVTFGTGRLRDVELPHPASGTLEHVLTGHGDVVLDLDPTGTDAEVADWLHSPTRVRVVNGLYRAERDEDFLVALDSLSASFDHVVHVARISATTTGWHPTETVAQGSSRSM